MSKLFEKLAKSAGAGFAEKFNQSSSEIEIYQFECEHEHIFFIQLNLPLDVNELADTFKRVQCPVCTNKKIKVKKTL